MAISSLSISPPVSSPVNPIVSNTATSPVDTSQSGGNKQTSDTTASATVTISQQGQKLSQTPPQTGQNQVNPAPTSQTQNNATQPGQIKTGESHQTNPPQSTNSGNSSGTASQVPQTKETSSAPGIQFMSGERKGGHVNTFA